jgi:hypothetical protein
MPRHHNTRITQGNLLRGIRYAEIHGKHKHERHVNVVGSNVHAPDMTKEVQKLDADTDIDPEVKGRSQINPEKTAENEFMATNPDMRGKQQARVFRGNRVYEWKPSRDFRPDAVGDVQRGGAFKGGFRNEANQKARRGYAQHIGHQRGGLAPDLEGLRNVNPFSVKLKVRAKDL